MHRRHKEHIPKAFFVVLGLAVLLFGAFFIHKNEVPRTPLSELIAPHHNFSEQAKLWQKEIQRIGPEASYKELVDSTQSLPNEEQHQLGHVFGRALYNEKGLDGFSICDTSLFGGCEHEFISAAIEGNGVSIINSLNDACIKRFGDQGASACEHGLGHGLLHTYDYTSEGLNKSLTMCAPLKSFDPLVGCFGGAFMEYNLHTVSDSQIRPYTPETPFDMCKGIPDSALDACYFWFPQWDMQAEFKDVITTESFAGIGAHCMSVKSEEQKDACFRGIGYIASPFAEFNADKTKAFCDATTKDSELRSYCWGQASNTTH